VGKLVQLWSPRSNNRLRRHWVSFGDRIIIGGESLDQAGVLSLRPAYEGELRARLRVMGREYEEAVRIGHDISVWINGLELFAGVKAIDAGRMLLVFGIPPGSRVNVTLEAGPALDEGTEALFERAFDSANPDGGTSAVGLRQTLP